jgi:hypothetical protein
MTGFALLNSLRIMGHGWPQGFAVAIMRRVRPDLEREHARILRQGPFDPEAIRAAARPRFISADNTDPVYLTLASKAQRESDERQVGEAHPTSWACVRRVLAPTSRAAHHGQKIHGPLPVRLRRAPSLIRGRWSLFSTVAEQHHRWVAEADRGPGHAPSRM